MNKQEAVGKINSMGKAGRIIAMIFRVVMIVGLVIIIAAIISVYAMPKDFVKISVKGDAVVSINLDSLGVDLSDDDMQRLADSMSKGTLELNGVMYGKAEGTQTDNGVSISAESETVSLTLRDMGGALIAAVISCASALVVFIFVGKLFKAFEVCASPFEEGVLKAMKNFGYSLIFLVAGSIFADVAQGILTSVFAGNGEMSIHIDFNIILIAMTIFGLTYIFRYGAILQQESDETI